MCGHSEIWPAVGVDGKLSQESDYVQVRLTKTPGRSRSRRPHRPHPNLFVDTDECSTIISITLDPDLILTVYRSWQRPGAVVNCLLAGKETRISVLSTWSRWQTTKLLCPELDVQMVDLYIQYLQARHNFNKFNQIKDHHFGLNPLRDLVATAAATKMTAGTSPKQQSSWYTEQQKLQLRTTTETNTGGLLIPKKKKRVLKRVLRGDKN